MITQWCDKDYAPCSKVFPDIEVIGEASNGEEAVEMDRQLQPDIFVMDVTMSKLDGIEATRRIKRQHPGTVVIGLSVHNSPHVEKEMRIAGETIKAVQHPSQRH